MTHFRRFDSSTDEPLWFPQHDGVMGGLSTGQAQIIDGTLQFSGEISLERNGGFAQVYSLLEETDFSDHTGIRLRIKGDGRVYQFRLASDARYRGAQIAYWSEFPTEAGQWTEVSLPFDSFAPSYRGRALQGPPLKLSAIQRIAFLLSDGKPGAFWLTVDWIGLESGPK
ncbi:MAG: CIA30 family protein [Opitutales bacterium]|nr:CIA30 family protein [Opitutales bacterium]